MRQYLTNQTMTTPTMIYVVLLVSQLGLCRGSNHRHSKDIVQPYPSASAHHSAPIITPRTCKHLDRVRFTNAYPSLILLRGGQYNDQDDYNYEDDRYYPDNQYYKEQENTRDSSSDRYPRNDYSRRRDNYYQEEEDYRSASRQKKNRSSNYGGNFSIKSYSNRKIGLPLLALGGLCMMAGIASFFNKFLLRLAHLFLFAGAPLVFGVGRMTGYFMNPKKSRATITFGAGFFLVVVGHPFFGMILEVFGFLNLFGNLFPLLKVMLRTVPGLGNIFPSDNGGGRSKRSSYSYEDNGDYRDGNVERYY